MPGINFQSSLGQSQTKWVGHQFKLDTSIGSYVAFLFLFLFFFHTPKKMWSSFYYLSEFSPFFPKGIGNLAQIISSWWVKSNRFRKRLCRVKVFRRVVPAIKDKVWLCLLEKRWFDCAFGIGNGFPFVKEWWFTW